jgi:hypothetical protein
MNTFGMILKGLGLAAVLFFVLFFAGCGGGGSSSSDNTGSSYSNLSLNGHWVTTSTANTGDNEKPYMVTDGNGYITDFGGFDMHTPIIGVYQVASNGATILTLYDASESGNDVTVTGSFSSATQFMFTYGTNSSVTFAKVEDLSLCAGTWGGTVTKVESEVTITYNILFAVDDEGNVTSLQINGVPTSISGKMFSANDHVSSFFRTGNAAPLDQFSIVGILNFNTISGVFIANQKSFNVSVTLTRT